MNVYPPPDYPQVQPIWDPVQNMYVYPQQYPGQYPPYQQNTYVYPQQYSPQYPQYPGQYPPQF